VDESELNLTPDTKTFGAVRALKGVPFDRRVGAGMGHPLGLAA